MLISVGKKTVCDAGTACIIDLESKTKIGEDSLQQHPGRASVICVAGSPTPRRHQVFAPQRPHLQHVVHTTPRDEYSKTLRAVP